MMRFFSLPLRPRCLVFALLAPLALAGCGTPEPFINKGADFDAAEISVCYNGDGTSREQVMTVVQEHCTELDDMVPHFLYQTSWQCRLTLPMEAHFRCVTPEDLEAIKKGLPLPSEIARLKAEGKALPSTIGTSAPPQRQGPSSTPQALPSIFDQPFPQYK